MDLTWVWDSLATYAASKLYVSPFYFWLFCGAAVIGVATALGWFFSFLRPIAGIVFVAIVSALFGYRKGEGDANAHHQAEEERAQRQAKREPWRW